MPMRSPSARVLENRVDYFLGVNARDIDGGFGSVIPLVPTGISVPSSVQYIGTEEVIDAQNRLTNVNVYMIMFGQPTGLSPRDLIRWVDGAKTRILYVQGSPPSEAGRQGAFTVRAIEKT